jgi:hypothetical protein
MPAVSPLKRGHSECNSAPLSPGKHIWYGV